jgi:hypothetical protein
MNGTLIFRENKVAAEHSEKGHLSGCRPRNISLDAGFTLHWSLPFLRSEKYLAINKISALFIFER